MRLEPYVSVDGVAFSAAREDVMQRHGRPVSEVRNEVGLTALDYGDVIYRFQDNGLLEEITKKAPVLTLGAIAVPFAALESFIREQDQLVFQRAGFLVSPKFGLAFVPTEPCWVTALDRHGVAQWEALRPGLAGM